MIVAWGRGVLVVVPLFRCPSVQNGQRIAIHLSSSELLATGRLRQLMTVLLLVLSAVSAWINDRLSVQMMIICLLHVSVIAVSSAWKTEQ